jgi:hypothetical protein
MNSRVFVRLIPCLAVAAIGLACYLALCSKSHSQDQLNALLGGSQSVKISKLTVSVGYNHDIQLAVVTNPVSLNLLTEAFRHSAKNGADGGRMYTATIWFQDQSKIRTVMGMPDDSSCLLVSIPSSMSLHDPAVFRIALPAHLAATLSNALGPVEARFNQQE